MYNKIYISTASNYLHSNHSIDEEDHSDQKSYIRQSLRDKKNSTNLN